MADAPNLSRPSCFGAALAPAAPEATGLADAEAAGLAVAEPLAAAEPAGFALAEATAAGLDCAADPAGELAGAAAPQLAVNRRPMPAAQKRMCIETLSLPLIGAAQVWRRLVPRNEDPRSCSDRPDSFAGRFARRTPADLADSADSPCRSDRWQRTRCTFRKRCDLFPART